MDMEFSTVKPDDPKIRLEQLRIIKGSLGRRVSEARQAGNLSDGLMQEFRSVSAEIKTLQKLLKGQLKQATGEERWAPPEIIPDCAILDRSVQGPLHVEVCDGGVLAAADAYVLGHPASSLWHRPVITAFIDQTYGHPTRMLGAFSDAGEFVGILTLVQLKSRLFGNFIVSVPYFNYGGLLADNRMVAEALIDAANQWRHQKSASHLELRHVRHLALELPQRTNKLSFWLPLPKTASELWGSFKPKLRAQIRRGEREMVSFALGGPEYLDDFYRVFSENMRDLGTPVYGRQFFRDLMRYLPGQTWLVVVKLDRKAVGCAFLARHRDRLEIPWASALRSVGHTGINMFMYWKILEFAIGQGVKVFDFGRCTENAGTYHFKKQWGAQPIPLHWDYVLAAKQRLPGLNPENPRYRLLIEAWKRLPVWVANLLGPAIVRKLP